MASVPFSLFVFWAFFSLSSFDSLHDCEAADPTDGFARLPLSTSNFRVQKPYDVPLEDRYSNDNGVHKFKVFSDDKPFKRGSPTKPRTEIRITGYDYSSGIWQFKGSFYVESGTTGVSIMQVHQLDGAKPATSLMLFVVNNELMLYSKTNIISKIYDRWVIVNVIHDVTINTITIFIDGIQKLKVNGRENQSNFYFKFGVYAQGHASHLMTSNWKDIAIYKKEG